MRRKILFGFGVLAVSAGGLLPASAQENAIAQWGGFYGGGHVGYAWSTPNATTEGEVEKLYTLTPPVGSRSAVDAVLEDKQVPLSFDGAVGGLHVGYNQQFKNFVLGIEGAYDWTQGDNSASVTPEAKLTNSSVINAINNGTTTLGDDARVNYKGSMGDIASVRGRVGFSNTALLVYGTGGVAWTDYALNITADAAPGYADGAFRMSRNLTGWVAGGGVEYKLNRFLSLRAEILHYDFGSIEYSIENEGAFEELAGKHDINFNEAHIGLSYHIN
jgi:outer membrane immunogenic protein